MSRARGLLLSSYFTLPSRVLLGSLPALWHSSIDNCGNLPIIWIRSRSSQSLSRSPTRTLSHSPTRHSSRLPTRTASQILFSVLGNPPKKGPFGLRKITYGEDCGNHLCVSIISKAQKPYVNPIEPDRLSPLNGPYYALPSGLLRL